MFSEIRQAILPLALRKLKRRGDLERAGLLIESLAKHWRDSKPFELLIVAPRSDVSLLRTSLPRFANIDVEVRSESDFFPIGSRFYLMTGWYRQQIVKLQVPAGPATGSNIQPKLGCGVSPRSPPPPTTRSRPSDKNECPEQ